MDIEPRQFKRKTRTVATAPIWIRLQHCTSRCRQKTLNDQCPIRAKTDSIDNTPVENELPVLAIKNDDDVDSNVTTIFVLGSHTSMSAHSFNDTDGRGSSPLNFARLTPAQSGNELCQTAFIQLDQTRPEFTFDKKDVVAGRTTTDGSLQKLALQFVGR